MGNTFSKSSFDKNQESFDENERQFRKASRNRGRGFFTRTLDELTAYGYSKEEMDDKEFSSHPASCRKYWKFLTSV